MATESTGCFFLEYTDEERNMRVQYHYWSSGVRYFQSIVWADGTVEPTRRISEKAYQSALEEYYNV